MTGSEKKSDGRVCLVGAGPGDEGLITVRGLEMLRRADVVIHDVLANPRLLREVSQYTECISVGARDTRKLSQSQINRLMLDRARRGLFVVRLKGGDPYLFGRGAEEAAFLGRQGIACEVVPGVTAGIAAPMAAGIPMTRRDLASTVTFVTGHEDASKNQPSVNYEALAGLIRVGGSACFYMGVGRAASICKQLRQHGLAAGTPVAVVQWGFTPCQRSIRSTIGSAEVDIAASTLGPPAIIVVGPVAGIHEPGLDFYTRRPLFGCRMVITRTRHQASALRNMLSELGAVVLEAPTIELVPPTNWQPVDTAIRQIDGFDWVVLTSVNGVEALHRRMEHLGLDSRHLANVKLAVVGDATAAALRQHLGIRADLMPERLVAESLARELIDHHEVDGRRFLMLRADIARPVLGRMLSDAGAKVRDLPIYETRRADALPDDVLGPLRDASVDWIIFASSSTARNMTELLGTEAKLLHKGKIASIGPITSGTIRELGFNVAAEARTSNLQGLVDAILEA